MEECVRHGVTQVYASPGSRSTPLILAASRHQQVQVSMHVDERASAFMALGYGRATGKPAVWITTSGTALANGYPAIVEADLEAVPMLLLTADRPPELRDTDANQTIRQDHLFGRQVRWFQDIPTPTSDIAPDWLLSTLGEAVRRAANGPVHLNCGFRKPLHPELVETRPRGESLAGSGEAHSPQFAAWLDSNQPFSRASSSDHCDEQVISQLSERLQAAEKPLVVLGRLRGAPGRIRSLAEDLVCSWGAMGVADIQSQARLGPALEGFIPNMDALLYGRAVDHLKPDLVIQFGASPVSRRLQDWSSEAEHIVVDDRPRRIDPLSRGGWRIDSNPVQVMQAAVHAEARNSEIRNAEAPGSWRQSWDAVLGAVRAWNAEAFTGQLTEQETARALIRQLPKEVSLTLASSNPVRHVDTFVSELASQVSVPISTNRGASGIDGTLATGCGFADGSKTRPVILLGDLALLHDMTSLSLCRQRGAIVLVINNDGGGIFSYLPIREHTDAFEPYFGTPHGRTFRAAAEQFGLEYILPATTLELESALATAFDREGATLIEVQTDREANLVEQRRLLGLLRDAVERARG